LFFYCFITVTNCFGTFLLAWMSKRNKQNDAVGKINDKARGSKIYPEGVFIRMGIIIAATRYNCRVCGLWARGDQDDPLTADQKTWQSIFKALVLASLWGNHCKGYHKVIPKIWENDQERRLIHGGSFHLQLKGLMFKCKI